MVFVPGTWARRAPLIVLLFGMTFAAGAGFITALRTEQEDPGLGGLAERGASRADASQIHDLPAGAARIKTAGDPAVDFPNVLTGFPQAPFRLAADNTSGTLWFAIFAQGDPGYKLYSYRPATDELRSFDIPVSPASDLFSSIAVDSRGHVILAYGYLVVDFDPLNLSYRAISLPPSPAHAAPLEGLEGTWVTDMTLGPGTEVYVARMNTSALTAVDLATGDLREIAIPQSFGPVYRVAASADGIWMTSWGDRPGAPSQTARLNASDGRFNLTSAKTSALLSLPDGTVLGASLPSPGLINLSAGSEVNLAPTATSSSLSGNWDFLAVDPQSGAIWMAGEGKAAITRYTPATGEARIFSLPVDVIPGSSIRCPAFDPKNCPETVEVFPRTRGLAVLHGDLYFSDVQGNRIGVVRAGSAP